MQLARFERFRFVSLQRPVAVSLLELSRIGEIVSVEPTCLRFVMTCSLNRHFCDVASVGSRWDECDIA